MAARNTTGKAQAKAATSQTTTKKGTTRKSLVVTIKPATKAQATAARAALASAVEAGEIRAPRSGLLEFLLAGATFRPMPLAAISNKTLRALCEANGADILTLPADTFQRKGETVTAKADRSTIRKGWFGEGNAPMPRGYLGNIASSTRDAWNLPNLVWIDNGNTVQVFATHADAPTPTV
jgi:hypothetical protein